MPSWIDFFSSGILLALYLYIFAIPSYYLFDSLVFAISLSPIISVSLTCFFAELDFVFDRSSSMMTVCVPTIMISILITIIIIIVRRGRISISKSLISELSVVVLYVGIACSVCTPLLIKNFCGPSSFYQTHDNVQHLNLIRSFVDSGTWSSLAPSPYLTDLDVASRPVNPIGFYPAAWNTLAAVVHVITGFNDAAFIENVLNVVLASVVYPTSMCGLIRILSDQIEENSWAWVAGALVIPVFAAFPWGFFIINPLYPNLLGLSLLPASLVLFLKVIEGLEDGSVSRARLVCYVLLVPVAFIALTLAHPNTIFSAFVMMIPAIYGFGLRSIERLGKGSLLSKLVYTALYVLTMLGIWYGLFNLPFLQNIVSMNHTWLSSAPLDESVKALACMQFLDYPSQYVLAVLVIVGLVSMIAQKGEGPYRFIVVSAMLCIAIYLACTIEGSGVLKHFISGFWYTDHHRTSALCVVPLACIASFGLGFLLKCVHRTILSLEKIEWLQPYSTMLIACLVAFACVASGVYATRKESAWNFIGARIDRQNNTAYRRAFGYDEQLFTEDIVDKIGNDALVINYPYDGSLYSYSVCGLRTMYRYDRNYLWETESDDSLLVREHLAEYAESTDVQNAVKNLGAEYVVLYDCGEDVAGTRAEVSPDNTNWDGILAIDEDTKGFDLVMHEDDMYLFRIDEAA